jgi:hypothetical protein
VFSTSLWEYFFSKKTKKILVGNESPIPSHSQNKKGIVLTIKKQPDFLNFSRKKIQEILKKIWWLNKGS